MNQVPGTSSLCLGEFDSEGSSYRVGIWEVERGQVILKAKAEEFTDMELKAVVPLPVSDRFEYGLTH